MGGEEARQGAARAESCVGALEVKGQVQSSLKEHHAGRQEAQDPENRV